jgi:hypothetical protein
MMSDLCGNLEVDFDRFTKPLDSINSVHKRHNFIRDLKAALVETDETVSGRDTDSKIAWLTSEMETLLAEPKNLEPKDSAALFELLSVPGTPNNYRNRYDGSFSLKNICLTVETGLKELLAIM